MELRGAVDVNRVAAGLSPMSWTDPAIVAGKDVRIRAVHFTELKSALQGLWTAAGMGSIAEFSGGAIVSGTRVIKASDPVNLRTWLEDYENSGYGQAKRARALYQYDGYDGSTQFGIGKRTSMWDVLGWSGQTWDRYGRLASEGRLIDGAGYVTQWTYDAMDRVYQLTLPDGEVLTHGYAANGLLSQVSSSLGPTYLSSVQYNALGLPAQYTLGSGTAGVVSHAYYGPDYVPASDPWVYGALKTIQLQQGSNPRLVHRDMGYDWAGNVKWINDLVNGENVAYGYDELDRLTSAGSPIGEGYVYNEIGNMTSKGGAQLYYGHSAHKHAVSSYNGVSYGYDANGCMTARGSQTMKYNPENMPVRVNSGGTTICRFVYDGDNVRRKRLDANGTIHYLGAYERNVGTGLDTTETVTKYYTVSLGKMTRLIALRKGGTPYYVGTDHLGGTIRVADAGFSAVDQMRYKPYGESRDAGTNLKTDHKFTSQIEDAVIGLYWYNSRPYDPVIGRFIGPDTVVPDPGSPQALNRYSYCTNKPLKYVDPTGHFFWLPLAAFAVGALVGYGWQVRRNLDSGMDLGSALTTNIRTEPILAGGALAFSVVVMAPAAIAAVGEGLSGLGIAAGSTALFAAGASTLRASEITAETVTGVLSGTTITNRLQGYVDLAAREVDAAGVQALTRYQQQAVAGNPDLYQTFRGTQIHQEFFRSVGSDASLVRLRLADRFVRSPDVIDPLSGWWWDVSKPWAWQEHLNRYASEFGPKGWPLLYK